MVKTKQKLKNPISINENRSHRIFFRCSLAEKNCIKEKSKKCNLPTSEYVRLRALDFKPKSLEQMQERTSLKNQSADLGRLGGLLKWLLTDPAKTTDKTIQKINNLLSQIEESQRLLQQIALRLV